MQKEKMGAMACEYARPTKKAASRARVGPPQSKTPAFVPLLRGKSGGANGRAWFINFFSKIA